MSLTWYDLTAFQRDALVAIGRIERDGDRCYGLAIKRDLERVYGDDVNHGRLYPNLNDLAEAGLVEISALDKRTNEYRLSDRAQTMLAPRQDRIADALGQRAAADGGQ